MGRRGTCVPAPVDAFARLTATDTLNGTVPVAVGCHSIRGGIESAQRCPADSAASAAAVAKGCMSCSRLLWDPSPGGARLASAVEVAARLLSALPAEAALVSAASAARAGGSETALPVLRVGLSATAPLLASMPPVPAPSVLPLPLLRRSVSRAARTTPACGPTCAAACQSAALSSAPMPESPTAGPVAGRGGRKAAKRERDRERGVGDGCGAGAGSAAPALPPVLPKSVAAPLLGAGTAAGGRLSGWSGGR